LSQVKVPQPLPPPQDNSSYIANQLIPIMNGLNIFIVDSIFDCVCMSQIPACPPDPCDDRVCLACVTVRDGKIIDICHFGCRRQLVTPQTPSYLPSLSGFDQISPLVQRAFTLNCCGERGARGTFFGASTFQRQNLTSAGFTNPGMVHQAVSMFIAQKVGASVINALAPNSPQTVDLRPLVGLETETALRSLGSYNIDLQNITTTVVDSDPAWNDDAGYQFTPAAFLPVDPQTMNANHLTMYTQGKLVVGFDVTDPVSVLKNQVLKLQQQVDNLSGAAGRPGVAPPSPPAPPTAPAADRGAPRKKKH
jgi:hypothetical protein